MREWFRESRFSPRNSVIGAMALGAAVGFPAGEAQLAFDVDTLNKNLPFTGLEAGLIGAAVIGAVVGFAQQRGIFQRND